MHRAPGSRTRLRVRLVVFAMALGVAVYPVTTVSQLLGVWLRLPWGMNDRKTFLTCHIFPSLPLTTLALEGVGEERGRRGLLLEMGEEVDRGTRNVSAEDVGKALADRITGVPGCLPATGNGASGSRSG